MVVDMDMEHSIIPVELNTQANGNRIKNTAKFVLHQHFALKSRDDTLGQGHSS